MHKFAVQIKFQEHLHLNGIILMLEATTIEEAIARAVWNFERWSLMQVLDLTTVTAYLVEEDTDVVDGTNQEVSAEA